MSTPITFSDGTDSQLCAWLAERYREGWTLAGHTWPAEPRRGLVEFRPPPDPLSLRAPFDHDYRFVFSRVPFRVCVHLEKPDWRQDAYRRFYRYWRITRPTVPA